MADKKYVVSAKSLHLCLTLCDPMKWGPSGSSVYGILQERIVGWVSMTSSRGSSWPRDQTHISYISCIGRWVLYHLRYLWSPKYVLTAIKNENRIQRTILLNETEGWGILHGCFGTFIMKLWWIWKLPSILHTVSILSSDLSSIALKTWRAKKTHFQFDFLLIFQ